MKSFLILRRAVVLVLAGVLCCSCKSTAEVTEAKSFDGASPLEWAGRLAQSEMTHLGDTLAWSTNGHAKWDYTAGLFTLSLLKLNDAKSDPKYVSFTTNAIGSFVNEDGSIKGYKREEFQLDALNPGKTAQVLWKITGEERYRFAALRLRAQLDDQPRTESGGFWHKLKYTQQMWLDGSYMALPFLARIAVDSHEPQSTFNDIAHQFELFDEHTYDIKSGLNYHGWDSARKQSWANPDTGASSNFWGRAEGWYAMALVDTLDYFPKNNTNRASLVKLLQKTCNGIIRHQDAESGLWWQVMDKPEEKGNYKEATASAMFVYTLAKGYNLNYLNTPEFKIAALKGYQGIIHQLVKEEPKGKWNLTQCCQVAGLSTTNAAGHSRDGSFAYYISEPVVENDLKGLGPLILAGIEIQNIVDGKKQLHIDLNK